MLAHENDGLLESKWSSKLAELDDGPEDINGSEDADRKCSVNISLLREALLHGREGYGRPVPGASPHVTSPPRGSGCRAAMSEQITSTPLPDEVVQSSVQSRVGGGRRGSQAVSGMRFPPATGAEGAVGLQEGAAPRPLRVESDSLVSPKWEMEYMPVSEEVPFLYEWQSPHVYSTGCDPVSVTQEVVEDPLPVSGLSGFIKEEPDLDLPVDTVENEVVEDPLPLSGLSGFINEDPDLDLPVDTVENEVVDYPLPVSGLSGFINEDPDLDLPVDTVENEVVEDPLPVSGLSGFIKEEPDLDLEVDTVENEVVEDPLPVSWLSGFIKEEPDLDLSVDTVENEQAVPREHAPDVTRRATLPEICAYIADCFPYYRHTKGWERPLSDQLSRKKCFIKLPPEGSKEKRSYWTLDQRYEDSFENGMCQREKRRKMPYSRARVGAKTYPTKCPTSTSTSSRSPSVFKVGCADWVACDSTHSGVNRCTDDTPISDTKTSTDVSATLTSTSGGETTADGGTAGSSEERRSSAAYVRPPFYYAELIAMAIKNSPQRRATLREICAYIASCFPYYQHTKGWQKPLGDRLSRRKWFVKLPPEGSKEKRSYWTLDKQYEDSFENRVDRQEQRMKLLSCRSRVGAETYPTHHHSESSPTEASCSSVSIGIPPTRDGPEVQIGHSVQCTTEREASHENGDGTIRPAVGREEASVQLRDAETETDERAECGRPTFSCSVCHREFAIKYKLKVHLRLHTGERPCVCSVCGKAFRLSKKMRRHWHLHSGERPYGCDLCGRKFKRRDHLKVHLSVHWREDHTAALSV